MKNVLLKIKWYSGGEVIHFNLSKINQGKFLRTTEYRPIEDKLLTFTTECTKFSQSDSKVELSLLYRRETNRALLKHNDFWGTCSLKIDLNTKRAQARWFNERAALIGGPRSISVLDESLLDELSYETIARIHKPKQSKLKRDLIDTYGKCALTGERTAAVLDAAHIISASNSGSFSIKNSFLLRTDIHRLFDRNLLRFSKKGKVILSETVADSYRKELRGKTLPTAVLEQIGEALAAQSLGAM